MSRDLHNNLEVSTMKAPIATTGDATTSSIDLQGYDAAEIFVAVGASGDTLDATNYWDLILQESDDNTVFTVVADGDVLKRGNAITTITSGIFATVDSTDDDNTTYKVGYAGGSRYVHVKLDATGTHTNGTVIGVVGVRGCPGNAPV